MQVEDTQTVTSTEAVDAPSLDINLDFRKLLTRDVVLLVVLGLVGWAVRYYVVGLANFPIRDGALTYQTALAVVDNNFRFPAVIPYNGDNFPFILPPLGIFAVGFASQQLSPDLLAMFRYLPAFFGALTVPVVYVLSRTLLVSKPLSFVAALTYALMPSNVILTVTGNGVMTTTGLFFALLAISQAYGLIVSRNENHLLPTIILTTLAFLCDFTTGFFAMNTAFLLMILQGRNRFSILNYVLLLVSTIVLVGLWFFPMMLLHGDRIYDATLSIVESGNPITTVIQSTNANNAGGEVLIPIMTITGFIGFFVLIARRRFFLPLWYISIVLLQPAKAGLLLTIPMAMMVGVTVVRLIFPLLADASFAIYEDGVPALRFARQEIVRNINKQVYHLPVFITAISLLAYAGYSVLVSADPLREPQIPDVELEAMAWINENMPEDASFLLITDSDDWQTDTIADWFPVLANRKSVINVRESVWNGTYGQQFEYYEQLTACKGNNMECLFDLEAQIAVDSGVKQEEAVELSASDLVRLRNGQLQQEAAPRLRIFDFVYISVRERGSLSGFMALDSQSEANYRSVRNEGGVLILQPIEDEPLDASQFTQ